MRDNLLNLALYQAGWFACVLGGAAGWPWWGAGSVAALGLVAVHVLLARDRRAEMELMLAAGAFGAVVDSLQAAAGLLAYASGTAVPWAAPPWDLVLWVQMATILRFALGWTRGRLALAALLGAVGGPVAFAAGQRLGAVAFHPRAWPSLIALAAVWALALPFLVWLAGRRGEERGGYRLSS